jgi:hypothetical protein
VSFSAVFSRRELAAASSPKRLQAPELEQNSPPAPIPKTQERERGQSRRDKSMPLYHFDLVNWKTIADQGGVELSDDIAAMDSADAMARRLLGERPDLKKRYYAILVTNDEGDEICRLPLEIIH